MATTYSLGFGYVAFSQEGSVHRFRMAKINIVSKTIQYKDLTPDLTQVFGKKALITSPDDFLLVGWTR